MEKDKPVEIKYQVLQWGPCIVHLKISEEFQQKLLKGAEEARKEYSQDKDLRQTYGYFKRLKRTGVQIMPRAIPCTSSCDPQG